MAAYISIEGATRSLVRARRANRRAISYRATEDARGDDVELRAGEVVLHGTVAYAEGAHEAMRVDLVQEGSEAQSSGNWTFRWTEIERKLTVAPFYLVQNAQNHLRIRVEPKSEASQLFDDLENRILVRLDGTPKSPRRERHAQLVPGESIWIAGRLERDHDPESTIGGEANYRASAAPTGWVLRGSPTLLVSSIPLADHFRRRARMHLSQALLLVLSLALPYVAIHTWVDRAYGETVVGEVISVSSVTNDDDKITGYRSSVLAKGRVWTSDSYVEAPVVGAPFTLRVGRSSSNDGDTVRWTAWEEAVAVFALLLAMGLRLGGRSYSLRALPWYRARHGYVEGGAGRLDPMKL